MKYQTFCIIIALPLLFIFSGCSKTPQQWLNVAEKAEKDGHIDDAKDAYQKVCEGNLIHGCLKLGMIYEELKDTPNAMKWMQIACEKGAVKGCFWVGGKETDDIKARHYLAMACKGQEYRACYELGLRWKKEGDMDKAVEFFGKACKKQVKRGCRAAGEVEYKRKNEKKAASWFRMGCEDYGDTQLCIVLGTWETDGGKAAHYFREACRRKDYEGCRRLGEMFERTGKKDDAKRQYDNACKGGDKKACELLEKLK